MPRPPRAGHRRSGGAAARGHRQRPRSTPSPAAGRPGVGTARPGHGHGHLRAEQLHHTGGHVARRLLAHDRPRPHREHVVLHLRRVGHHPAPQPLPGAAARARWFTRRPPVMDSATAMVEPRVRSRSATWSASPVARCSLVIWLTAPPPRRGPMASPPLVRRRQPRPPPGARSPDDPASLRPALTDVCPAPARAASAPPRRRSCHDRARPPGARDRRHRDRHPSRRGHVAAPRRPAAPGR